MDIDILIKELKIFKKSGVKRVHLMGNDIDFIKTSHDTVCILDTHKESL